VRSHVSAGCTFCTKRIFRTLYDCTRCTKCTFCPFLGATDGSPLQSVGRQRLPTVPFEAAPQTAHRAPPSRAGHPNLGPNA